MKGISRSKVILIILIVWAIFFGYIWTCAISAERFYKSPCSKITRVYANEEPPSIILEPEAKPVPDVTTLPEVVYTGTKNYKDDDITTIAKLLYGECRGIPNRKEKEAVVWVVLNRVDDNRFPNTIYDVVTAKGQFEGYNVNHPVWDDLYEISRSVLDEWNKEKNGESSNRSLPNDYFFFHGDGVHNWFRKEYKDKTYFQF